MQRSKIRKLVAALPAHLPPMFVHKATVKIANPKARAQVLARHARKVAGR